MHFKIASHIISYSKLEGFEEAEKVESVNGFLKILFNYDCFSET